MDEKWNYDPAHDLGLPQRDRLRSLRREAGLAGAASNLLWRGIMRVYLAAMHRLEIEGRQNFPPKPPFVVIANHSSHLDAVILGLTLRVRHVGRVFPIAAGDTFFEKPLLATFATACMNALPIWRRRCGAHSLEDLRRRLIEESCIFILFPEGTRTRTGEMASFKPGLGRLVCGVEVPVVPCHISGAWEAMPPDRSLPRPVKIRVRVSNPLSFADLSNTREGWNTVAAESERAVRALAGAGRPA